MQNVDTCPHCGLIHSTTCPRVSAIEYTPDGRVRRVEFHAPVAVLGGATAGRDTLVHAEPPLASFQRVK